MDDFILKSEWDGVLELVFNRPEKLNAITHSMFKSVRASVDELRRRSDLRVMLIRGKGRYFSAGADLTEGGTPDFEGSPSKVRTWMRTTECTPSMRRWSGSKSRSWWRITRHV
jgi:enoyl-CoA hydratase/carnithine racemase